MTDDISWRAIARAGFCRIWRSGPGVSNISSSSSQKHEVLTKVFCGLSYFRLKVCSAHESPQPELELS
ncbi:hypothetical protein [Microcoleus sp. bin38.metabat.b11b12b14.051]|uniref:hypothetical protein n=1 Tax=Microcoleus sp. bin38.metabat.b11b12b14.051 TaxID=2742709 RepID=UPI0025F562E9|nr:hypothetical protein [Microcoleus sp. bin38.metabat.b11b12b14.051]